MTDRTLEYESSIKTIIGEMESRIDLFEDAPNPKIDTYMRGKLDAYKEFVKILEDIVK